MTDFEHNEKKFNLVEVVSTDSILGQMEVDKIRPGLGPDGRCLANAILTAKESGAVCVEGFVFCMVLNTDKVIRHCWNLKDGKYFDPTKDYVWTDLPGGQAKKFMYFLVSCHSPNDYIVNEKGEVEFLSDVVSIAGEIDKLLRDNK